MTTDQKTKDDILKRTLICIQLNQSVLSLNLHKTALVTCICWLLYFQNENEFSVHLHASSHAHHRNDLWMLEEEERQKSVSVEHFFVRNVVIAFLTDIFISNLLCRCISFKTWIVKCQIAFIIINHHGH